MAGNFLTSLEKIKHEIKDLTMRLRLAIKPEGIRLN